MIIKISLCFRDSKPASENRRGEILRAGFAVASGYCDHIVATVTSGSWRRAAGTPAACRLHE